MAVEISKFYGKWVVNRVDSVSELQGVTYGDPIEISEGPSSDRARVVVKGKTFDAELREGGLCCDEVSPITGPTALQISVYEQFEAGHPFYYRALYGTAIKKDPQNIGVWGAEEDESGK